MAKKEKINDTEKIDFEAALSELENISARLAEGNIPLEESIGLFERGMELKKLCGKRLNQAQNRIKILLEENGGLTEKNFETEGENE